MPKNKTKLGKARSTFYYQRKRLIQFENLPDVSQDHNLRNSNNATLVILDPVPTIPECVQDDQPVENPKLLRADETSLQRTQDAAQDSSNPNFDFKEEITEKRVPFLHYAEKPQLDDVSLSLLSLASTHNISDCCLKDIIQVVKIAQSSSAVHENLSPDSIRKSAGISSVNVHYYWTCKSCQNISKGNFWKNPIGSVKCEACATKPQRSDDNFIIIDLIHLLSLVLPEVWADFQVECGNGQHINCSYVESLKESLGHGKHDISLTINTDGVPLFKSSRCHIYPLLATINELCYSSRRRNVLLIGVWVGTSSGPDPHQFLSPVLRQVRTLEKEPFEWKQKTGELVKTKVIVTNTLCDSIARPAVMNMTQFNATFGCSFCYQKTVKKDTGLRTCYFPHSSEMQLRSNAQHDEDCKNAERRRASASSLGKSLRKADFDNCNGVKGYSVLQVLPYYDVIKGFPPDIMHTVYLGVVRQFTNLWLNPSNSKQQYYLSCNKIDAIDQYLLSITVPHTFSRATRQLSSNIKFYKAHEWRNWLFYYSSVILFEMLPSAYFQHWCDLIRGIYELTLDEVREDNIETAQFYLNRFSERCVSLYDGSACTFNVHLLLHLPTIAGYLGPLQHFSMAAFEDFNFKILKYVKGSQFPSSQIIKSYLSGIQADYHRHFSQTTNDNITSLGKSAPAKPDSTIGNIKLFNEFKFQLSFYQEAAFFNKNISIPATFFKRVCVGARLFQSTSYTKAKKKNSSCVMLQDGSFITVNSYFSCNDKVYAVGTVHDVTSTNFNLPYVFEQAAHLEGIVEVEDIVSYGLKIIRGGKTYLINTNINTVEGVHE